MEENEQAKIEKRKEILKIFLTNNQNLVLILVILFALIVGGYYFSLTKNQPLWWDEADYMAYAKNLAGFGVDWIVTSKHNSMFPYFAAGLLMLGLSEVIIKFIIEFIPYLLISVLTFITVNLMYKDRRLATIASFLMITSWNILFNAMRFHVDIPALVFGILAFYVFWKGYERKEKIFGKINPQWAIPISVVLVILTYSIRRGYFLFGLFFFVYMLLTKDWKELSKDKYNWIGLIIAVILIFTVESFIFSSGVSQLTEGYAHVDQPITFLPLQVFNSLLGNPSFDIGSVLLYLFIIGFLLILGNIFLHFGHIKKSNYSSFVKQDLFNFLTIIITLSFFIFILREQSGFGEARWYFPLMFSSLVMVGRATIFICDKISKDKTIQIILITLLIGFGGYYQIQVADNVIKSKISSFQGIKDTGLYLKENSNKDDLILTLGQPQVEYYSERKTIHAREWVDAEPSSQEHFEKSLKELTNSPDIKYLLISFSEPGYPNWMKIQTQTSWEIPFMETKIDLITGVQDIKKEKIFNDIKFTLIGVKQDVFIYKIDRV